MMEKKSKMVSVSMVGVLILLGLGLITPARGEVKLSVWSREQHIMPSIVEAFNSEMAKQGKAIKVEYSYVSGDVLRMKLLGALASGKPPHILSQDLILVPYFNSIGAYVDITEEFNRLPFKEDLAETMLELGIWENRIYAVPFASDCSGMLYNKGLYEKFGIGGPAVTWDEWVTYCQKTTKDTNGDGRPDLWGTVFAGAEGGMYMFTWMPFVWGNGGRIISDDGKTCLIDSPEAIEAAQLWVDMVQKYKVAPPASATYKYSDYYSLWTASKVSSLIGGNWMVSGTLQDAPELEFGTAYTPKSKDGYHASFNGGDMLMIPRQVRPERRHYKEAWEFIKFTLTERVQKEILGEHGVIPIRKSIWRETFADNPRYLPFALGLERGRAPKSVNYNEMEHGSLESAMQMALSGEWTSKYALEWAAKRLTELFRR